MGSSAKYRFHAAKSVVSSATKCASINDRFQRREKRHSPSIYCKFLLPRQGSFMYSSALVCLTLAKLRKNYQWCGLRPSILGQDRSETKKIGLAVLVLFCESWSCHARRHNYLEGESNFSSTIYSFSILCLEHHYCGDQQWRSLIVDFWHMLLVNDDDDVGFSLVFCTTLLCFAFLNFYIFFILFFYFF